MHKSQVNTDNTGESYKYGPITKGEIKRFRSMTWPGDILRCHRPRRRSDEEVKVIRMTVLKTYPHIVTLEYMGVCGKMFETSMTWAEAIMLNWRPRKKSKAS